MVLRWLLPAILLPLAALATPPPAGSAAPLGIRQTVALPYFLASRLSVDVAGGPGLQGPPVYGVGAVSGWWMWQPTRQIRQLEGTAVAAPDTRFSFGLGLRLTHLRTRDSSRFDGRGAADGQWLLVDAPQLTALNAALQLQCRLLGAPDRHPLSVGFNIDLGGLSFGPARTAQAFPRAAPPLVERTVQPRRGNVLLGNAHDRGTLNSELYLAWKAQPHLTVRAGWAHVAAGYVWNGHRYQQFANLAVVGLSWGVRRGGRA